MQKKIALKAEGLQAGYGERNVLSGLDLEVPAGEIFALLGGNGAGKSTLLSVFLGLLKPRAGRVWVGEIDVLRDPEAAPMSAPLPTRFETDINIAAAGLLAPLTALRRVSMATAETDLAGYRSFLEQAEAYRFRLVQTLNQMQADLVKYAEDTDSRKVRVDADHFRHLKGFDYVPQSRAALLARVLTPLAVLGVWTLAALAALWVAGRRLQRIAT